MTEDVSACAYNLLQELAETGQISLSQTAVSKLIGQLFIVKSSVNLESGKRGGQASTQHSRTLRGDAAPASRQPCNLAEVGPVASW